MGHFLDIGAGPGRYTKLLAQGFALTTVVEPNEIYFQEVMGWAKDAGCPVQGFNADWFDVDLKTSTDFVLMNHMLYQVPRPRRLEFIGKAFATLHSGGIMMITLNSENCGIRQLRKAFLPRRPWLRCPMANRSRRRCAPKATLASKWRTAPGSSRCASRADMDRLVNFLLMRKVADTDTDSAARREAFIDTTQRGEGEFVLDSENTIVTATKP